MGCSHSGLFSSFPSITGTLGLDSGPVEGTYNASIDLNLKAMQNFHRPLSLVGLLLPLSLLGLATPSESQTVPSPYRFVDTVHDVNFLVGVASENRGHLDLGPGGGPLMGLRYSFHLSGPFALETLGFLLDTDRRVFDPTGEDGLEELGTTSSIVGSMDGRIRFTLTGDRTWNQLAPFVQAGAGLVGDVKGRARIEEEMSDDARFNFGPSLLGVLGAGTMWLPGDRFGIRAEVVMHIWKLGTPRAFRNLEEELGPISDQEWTAVNALIIGGSLRF